MLAYYELTTKCNAHCKHCIIPDILKYDEPIERQFSDITSDFSYLKSILGVTKIVLSGGEPTTRFSLPEIVHYARTQFRDVAVISNGSNFDILHNLPCKIWVSIDYYGYKQDRYRQIKMWDNYLKLSQNVNVRSTMLKDNLSDLKQLIKLTHDNKKEITIVPYKGVDPNLIPTPKNVVELTHYILNNQFDYAVIDDSAVRAYIDSFIMSEKFVGCYACESLIRVKANGQVTPCPFLNTEICSVYDPQIKQKIDSYRQLLLTDYPELCKKCSKNMSCGGCKASRNLHCPVRT